MPEESSISLIGVQMESRKHGYLINMAKAASEASKDPSTKVGAIIARPDGSIASSGYNGFVKKCNEAFMTHEKPMKYLLVRHAEKNAISHCLDQDMSGYIMYITHAPCNECLKDILHEGIREIYYASDELTKKASKEANEAVIRLIASTEATVMNVETERSYVAEIADLHGWEWAQKILNP